MKLRVACAVACVVLALPCVAAAGLTIDELDANASLAFLASNSAPGEEDPTHAFVPLLGVSMPLRLAPPFFIEPGLEFLGWYYRWIDSTSAAEITQAENGFGFFTIGALLSMQGGASFPVSRAITLGGTVGLDFLIRFPFETQNTTSSVKDDEGRALTWFYSKGRFLYPETRLFMRWHISEPVDLLVNLRAFYPVFHLWDGDGQPFWDQIMVSLGVGFGVRLASIFPPAQPK